MHDNVIRLFGVTADPLMMVIEFCGKGSLHALLRNAAPGYPDQPGLLVTFVHQIGLGMEYLATLHFIHRDLATRNVLVTDADVVRR